MKRSKDIGAFCAFTEKMNKPKVLQILDCEKWNKDMAKNY